MVGTLLESSYFENIKVPALAHRLAYPYSARRPTRSQCPLGVGRQDHCQRVSQSVAPSPLSEALPRQVHARRSNLLTRRRLLPPARIVSRVP